MGYQRPSKVEDALRALAARPPGAPPPVVLAGGTDHYPARVGPRPEEEIIDISALPGFAGITESDAGWRVGALTTWSALIEASLPPLFDGLKAAAREVGGAQVQNRGTLGGNLCNASPAADGIPPLLSLDAEVELVSARGTLRLSLGGYVLGNRQTARRTDELLAAVHVPRPTHPARGDFLKLGARAYLVISIAMVAAVIERAADGHIAAARVAIGACSACAQRLTALERDLVGKPIDAQLGRHVAPEHLAALSPIDDVRGSAEYRREAALTITRRLLDRMGRHRWATA